MSGNEISHEQYWEHDRFPVKTSCLFKDGVWGENSA